MWNDDENERLFVIFYIRRAYNALYLYRKG